MSSELDIQIGRILNAVEGIPQMHEKINGISEKVAVAVQSLSDHRVHCSTEMEEVEKRCNGNEALFDAQTKIVRKTKFRVDTLEDAEGKRKWLIRLLTGSAVAAAMATIWGKLWGQ